MDAAQYTLASIARAWKTGSGTPFLWNDNRSAFIAAIHAGSCESRLVLVEIERVLLARVVFGAILASLPVHIFGDLTFFISSGRTTLHVFW